MTALGLPDWIPTSYSFDLSRASLRNCLKSCIRFSVAREQNRCIFFALQVDGKMLAIKTVNKFLVRVGDIVAIYTLRFFDLCTQSSHELCIFCCKFISFKLKIGQSTTSSSPRRSRWRWTTRWRKQHSAILHGRFSGTPNRTHDRPHCLPFLCRIRGRASHHWKVPIVNACL